MAASAEFPSGSEGQQEQLTAMRSALSSSEIVVGLDLGTTKVSAVVGEVDADGITILGVGNVPCRGLRKGVVSNIEWTVRSIREAIEAAQTMAGVEIKTALFTGFRSFSSDRTFAESTRNPSPVAAARTVMPSLADPPAGRFPTAKITRPAGLVKLPCVAVADRNDAFDGSWFVTVTADTAAGPRFVTISA